ncbi:nucleotidyltransferase family protein [Paenibacillus segetis]|uniref:Nucleotidyltransferase family protein n=1 Tax=Paenibacillus segetis TaxID=1325360 RepID=A0ABQ1YCH5_9BACL|nr:nucleotidyltransferase family protein [Paenibacillus segetis]GGH19254.1 hypothetical protein GCM10008013_15800 [Paenibacillus segetis]
MNSKITNLDTQGLLDAISQNADMMADLRSVSLLSLPQACIAAGYIRNYVWDILHGYEIRTPYNDVDVIYYDPSCIEEEIEKSYEAKLKEVSPAHQWSVKNQARMHLKSGASAFRSVEDAMLYWPETATAVGVRLDARGEVELIAPHGMDDLLTLRLRQSSYCRDHQLFMKRITDKEWLRIWPQLRIVEDV